MTFHTATQLSRKKQFVCQQCGHIIFEETITASLGYGQCEASTDPDDTVMFTAQKGYRAIRSRNDSEEVQNMFISLISS